MYKIENKDLVVTIDEHGAEMKSIRYKGKEYLWEGDAKYWGRQAPNLFPFVGKLKEDHYFYQGKEYHQTQHGFARDLDFEVVEQSQEKIVLRLTETPQTLAHFPFRFIFEVSYELEAAAVRVMYHVVNPEKTKLYFSVGAHPGFKLPDERKGKNKVVFETENEKTFVPVKLPEVLLDYDHRKISNTAELILEKETFRNGVLVYETNGKTKVTLKDAANQAVVSVRYTNMSYFGLWSTYPEQAPFLCIEPWCGVADTVDSEEELTKKLGIQTLNAGEEFSCSYEISLY